MYAFQSTHPLRGATFQLFTLAIVLGDFNPRTPCGVRRSLIIDHAPQQRISIHAPLAGCDGVAAQGLQQGRGISIHAPLAGCDPL